MDKTKIKRILLKLTGEVFGNKNGIGIDFEKISVFAKYLNDFKNKTSIEIVIVVGAGNLFRARNVKDKSVDRVAADNIGMLGTIMNALALQEELERYGSLTRVLSTISMPEICEQFIKRKAIRHLEKGRIVIIGGGTGNPFFTTDSAAALKACELKCDILLKGSNVDGIYSSDPKKDTSAIMYKKLTYKEALVKNLMVMDNTAFSLCQNENIPIVIFNISSFENIEKIINGEEIGSIIVQSQ